MKKSINSVIHCILSMGALVGSEAQVTVEEDVTTDTVNVFAQAPDAARKSAALAMIQSIILPGTGHHYLERPNSALAYLTLETISIFGLIFCDQYSKKLNRDAAAFAAVYAQAQGGAGADENYWQRVGEYMGLEEYNLVHDLNRDNSQYIARENLWWRWGDESFKDEYTGIRENSRRFRIGSTFFLAAMVLNRAISFIEIRASTRYKGIQTTSQPSALHLRPEFDVNASSLSFSLQASF